MGHRASVAYETPDGVSVHYSHWGAFDAELLDQITPDAPLGSVSMEPEFVSAMLSGLEEATGGEVEGYLAEPQDDTPVEPEPYAVVDSIEEWASAHVDPVFHECTYIVEVVPDFNVRALAPIYLRDGWSPGPGGDPGFVLVDAGGESHQLWGGREDFDGFMDFVDALLAEHGDTVEYVVPPEGSTVTVEISGGGDTWEETVEGSATLSQITMDAVNRNKGAVSARVISVQ